MSKPMTPHLVHELQLGKQVEFVRFPGATHSFPASGHPRLMVKHQVGMLDQFDRHLKVSSAEGAGAAPAKG